MPLPFKDNHCLFAAGRMAGQVYPVPRPLPFYILTHTFFFLGLYYIYNIRSKQPSFYYILFLVGTGVRWTLLALATLFYILFFWTNTTVKSACAREGTLNFCLFLGK